MMRNTATNPTNAPASAQAALTCQSKAKTRITLNPANPNNMLICSTCAGVTSVVMSSGSSVVADHDVIESIEDEYHNYNQKKFPKHFLTHLYPVLG